MGCGSSDTKSTSENIPPPRNDFIETKEEENIKKQVNQKQNDIIEKYQKKKGNTKTVSLSNISSCFIKFWNTEKGPKFSIKSRDENILKFLEDINPFNENIKNNKDLNKLQTELYETELYYSKTSQSKPNNKLQVKSTQKIHNKYNLNLKLKNLGTNQSETFDFNDLDKPLLIIFFDFKEEKALNKILEFKKKEKELEENEEKNFLLLPIINIFVDQYESVSSSKRLRKMFDLLKSLNGEDKDYYVLIKNVNDHFTHLFELEKMNQSKCIFINRNSEISLIFDEKIEYLNYEIIDFFLNTRNSEYSKDYFTAENKQDIINILEKNCNNYNNLKKKYKFDIDLKVISSEKQLPVYLRFTYNEKEKDKALKLYKEVTDEIKTKISAIFCSEYMQKDNINELFNLIKILQGKINGEMSSYKNVERNQDVIPFILSCNSIIINDNNEHSNNSNINDICKFKKYSLNYYINEELYFPQIINLFNSYLNDIPKYMCLNCPFQIYPIVKTKIKNKIPKCKEVKITEEILKSKQIKLINIPESEINFEKQNIEVFLLLDNTILIEEEQRKKINIIIEALYSNDIKFILFFFGENDFDIQKINLLSLDKFFSADKKEIGKIIYLNKLSEEVFYQFYFYSQSNFFKMFRLDKDYNLLNIYNLDLYDSNNFTVSNIKNRNIFNFLLYISKKDNLDLNINNIPNNNENDYKNFKENKKKIYEILSNTDIITKSNSNKLLMNIYINFTYNKLYVLSKQDIENSKINNKKYYNAFLILTYLDYIQDDIIEEIKEIISKNNNRNKSSINIKLREKKISTINILPNPLTVFECPKCERSYTLEQNSFYFCVQCQEKQYFCEECYRGFYAPIKDKKKAIKTKEKGIFHEHHLILFFKYNQNKSSFIIKEKYEKYKAILNDKKGKKNFKTKCDICNNYESFDKTKIIMSHFKKKKLKDGNKTDYNSNDIEEISICNKCFKSNISSNILCEEHIDNNIIIF
jgi:hypothetical protein